jgi:hypothetical protein
VALAPRGPAPAKNEPAGPSSGLFAAEEECVVILPLRPCLEKHLLPALTALVRLAIIRLGKQPGHALIPPAEHDFLPTDFDERPAIQLLALADPYIGLTAGSLKYSRL